ncbi:hypothetical protein [Cystobacter ferrugineus]|uniref:Lipoprotein n=1 Tax=Cystobacter ferrugineus TaxID=83449 RepID=A0A1L9B1J3_9BACT|nr:hypothetical protein [Cystobacter ferrugineus]OJH36129.1 hypothetical protein BON30_33720 [Cystobacter ferrugineus]
MEHKRTSFFLRLLTLMSLAGCTPENPPPAQQPTLHGESILSADETWRAADNPHIVTGPLTVGGTKTPTLTLEAGVVVRFEPNASLSIGVSPNHPGELRVEGTENAPVLLTARSDNPQPGHWKGVMVGDYSSDASRLAHVTIEYATGVIEREHCVQGSLTVGATPRTPHAFAVADHVTVQKSRECGVVMYGDLGPGSTRLIARDNGGVAISVEADSVGSIPENSLMSGNALDAVQVHAGAIWKTQTWPRLGVPYLVEQLSIYDVDAALTLPPGTELHMRPEAIIGIYGVGRLIAQGEAQAPIRFVPDTTTPSKEHWKGLMLVASSQSRLDHVLISHAGSTTTGSLFVAPAHDGTPGPFVTHSTFRDSVGCGITTSTSSTGVPLDYTLAEYGNTFLDNELGAQCYRTEEPGDGD